MAATVDRLGYFDAFMRAWGRLDASGRAQVAATTAAYRAGLIDARTEVEQVSQLLSIPVPAGW